MKIDRTAWLLLVVCVFVMLPFLGLADFNTKGEPREAVVTYSILDIGNWILPTNNGGEMPYKPPFFYDILCQGYNILHTIPSLRLSKLKRPA